MMRQLPKRLLKALLRAYQLTLSPYIGRQCTFYPTCSHYAMDALETHGVAKGSWLAVKRVCRCHPFNPGGFDPVELPQSASHVPAREES